MLQRITAQLMHILGGNINEKAFHMCKPHARSLLTLYDDYYYFSFQKIDIYDVALTITNTEAHILSLRFLTY